MDKPQIIGLGLNGLVGSRVKELLSNKFEFISLSRSTGVDITDKSTLGEIEKHKKANFILHLAAKTDVDLCEEDKDLRIEGEAWKINVLGTQNVADFARDFGKKLIFISTDFVFDGEKEEGYMYSEEDTPNPINWYATTKFEGEKVVEKSGADYTIVRLAFPYRANYSLKNDFVKSILEKLQNGEEVKAVSNQIFCPTFIDDIAYALDELIENDASGIYHVVGSSAITPYDATKAIASTFGLDANIEEVSREEFFAGRAPRPFNLALRNDKIGRLGVRMRSFELGLLEIKKQLETL